MSPSTLSAPKSSQPGRSAVSTGGAGSAVGEGYDVIVTDAGSVLVTSHTDHRVMEFDLDGNYSAWGAYGRAKLANFHFAIGLQREFERRGLAAQSLAAADGRLLVAADRWGLAVVDVGDPTSPRVIYPRARGMRITMP